MADSMTNTEMLLAYIETLHERDLSNRAPAKEELMEDQPVPITPNSRKRKAPFQTPEVTYPSEVLLTYIKVLLEEDLSNRVQKAKELEEQIMEENQQQMEVYPITPNSRNASFQVPEVTYPAEAFKALCGKNETMVYHFEDKCYSFMFKRANKNRTSVYVCSGCKQNKSSKEVRVTLYGGRFMENPLEIPHVCQPINWAAEVAKRKVYETTQKLKYLYGKTTPKEAFDRLKNEMLSDESYSKEDRQAVVDKLGSFESHRRALSRAVNMLKPDGPEAKKKKTNLLELEKQILATISTQIQEITGNRAEEIESKEEDAIVTDLNKRQEEPKIKAEPKEEDAIVTDLNKRQEEPKIKAEPKEEDAIVPDLNGRQKEP